MKNVLQKWLLPLCAVLLLFGCKKDDTLTITLNKQELNLIQGETQFLHARVESSSDQVTPVTWSSDNTHVAVVNEGEVTAVGVGTAIITATAGNVSATCKVTVSGKPVTAITLDKSEITLRMAGTETLTATVEPEDAGDKTVVWSSDDTDVATVAEGVVTAVGPGNAVITAQAGDQTATCNVTVLDAPKIGDYYYSDGTWSDGGLVSIEADGLNPVWISPRPAPKAGKTVVGMVFQTNPDRLAATDKEKGYVLGYVVAVKNAHSAEKPTVEYSKDYTFASTPQAKIAKTWYTNVNGYYETMKVKEDYGANIGDCPAFDITLNSFSLTAPETSSGWFLPSTGQLWDMVANLCGHEVAVFMKQWQTSNYNVYHGYNVGEVSYSVIDKFNENFAMLPDDGKELVFITNDYYDNCCLWATTCFEPEETACIINLGGSKKSQVELMCEYIDYDGVARPILAF